MAYVPGAVFPREKVPSVAVVVSRATAPPWVSVIRAPPIGIAALAATTVPFDLARTSRLTSYVPGLANTWTTHGPLAVAPSEKRQTKAVMRSSGSWDAFALNTTDVPTFPTDRDGVMTATGGAFTYSVWFALAVSPALSVMTSVTTYDPKDAYACVGYGVPPVKFPELLPPLPVPSPKSHRHETMYPSGSYE